MKELTFYQLAQIENEEIKAFKAAIETFNSRKAIKHKGLTKSCPWHEQRPETHNAFAKFCGVAF